MTRGSSTAAEPGQDRTPHALASSLTLTANGLTVARLLLVPLLVSVLLDFCADAAYRFHAAALVLALQMSDVADGALARLARRLGAHPNRIGALLDPLADKAFINATYLTLALAGSMPKVLAFTILLRDGLLVVVWLFRAMAFHNTSVVPNVVGKVADTLQAFFALAFILAAPPAWLRVGIVLTIATTVLSGVLYCSDVASAKPDASGAS